MSKPVSAIIDLEKLFQDFDYYCEVIKLQNENGRFFYSFDDRLKLDDATIQYEDRGLLKPKHGFKNLAPFA